MSDYRGQLAYAPYTEMASDASALHSTSGSPRAAFQVASQGGAAQVPLTGPPLGTFESRRTPLQERRISPRLLQAAAALASSQVSIPGGSATSSSVVLAQQHEASPVPNHSEEARLRAYPASQEFAPSSRADAPAVYEDNSPGPRRLEKAPRKQGDDNFSEENNGRRPLQRQSRPERHGGSSTEGEAEAPRDGVKPATRRARTGSGGGPLAVPGRPRTRRRGPRREANAPRDDNGEVDPAQNGQAPSPDPMSYGRPSDGEEPPRPRPPPPAAGAQTGKKTNCCCRDFPCCCIHCPFLLALLVILAVPAFIGGLWPGIIIDTELDTFLEADGKSQDVHSAFQSSLELRGPPATRRLAARRLTWGWIDPNVLHKITRLRLLYRAKKPEGILNIKTLYAIRGIENKLKNLPGWKHLCNNVATAATRGACNPGITFISAVWPEENESTAEGSYTLQTMVVNGEGPEALPINAALELTYEKEGIPEMVFPKGYVIGDHLTELRSVYEFNLPCCTKYEAASVRISTLNGLEEDYASFVEEELYPALLSLRGNGAVDLFWEGSVLDTLEMWMALQSDAMMAVGSFIFILVFLAIHTKSLCFAAGVVFTALLAIPCAFVLSAVLSGTTRVTGTCFLSLFLIIGFGVDDVLVFITFWDVDKSGLAPERKDDRAARIRHMYREAGFACLATSATTAASFFANLASALRPMREFGFFMGLCIVCVYFLMISVVPTLLVLREKKCCCRCPRKGKELSMKLWADVRKVCGEQWQELQQKIETNTGFRIPERHGSAVEIPSLQDNVRFYITRLLVPYRCVCLLCGMLIPVILLIWTAAVVSVDSGMPQMFPAGHNPREVVPVAELFAPQDQWWPLKDVKVCHGSDIFSSQPSGCALNWCQLTGVETMYGQPVVNESNPADVDEVECMCQPAKPPSGQCGQSASLTATSKFVGLDNISADFWDSEAWKLHIQELLSTVSGTSVTVRSLRMNDGHWQLLKSLVQEDWESGYRAVNPYYRAPKATAQVTVQSSQGCNAHEVCYCGTYACDVTDNKKNSWSSVVVKTEGSKDEDGGRRLLAPPMGRRLMALSQVEVVWGMSVRGRTEMLGDVPETLFSFSGSFHPEAPSVQRHILQVCEALEASEDLRIATSSCWITLFRDWLKRKGEIFPLRPNRFAEMIVDFAWKGGMMPATGMLVGDAMWFDDAGGLAAAFIAFQVPYSFSATPAPVLVDYKAAWDRELKKLMVDAPMEAGSPWHSSRLWIRAEAENAIVSSTMNTMIWSSAMGFFGALLFTFDLPLASIVFLCVTGVTCCLAWTMAVILGWSFGPVEVLGLIIFVGYSITFSIHVAAKYSEVAKDLREGTLSERRREAVTQSLLAMTGSILGSATTTLGASFFLFFCTLLIFVKLASILFAVTFFAVLFALVVLPSVLLVAGPLGCCGHQGLKAAVHAVRGMFQSDAMPFRARAAEDAGVEGSVVADSSPVRLLHRDSRAWRQAGVDGSLAASAPAEFLSLAMTRSASLSPSRSLTRRAEPQPSPQVQPSLSAAASGGPPGAGVQLS